ncbi:hypothetical protein [Streptomyces murinus]|uniref:hypothetical protein n=1 Tax=Streptomyces murinus TaxID=33900 RepID=UPI0037290248
MPRGITAWTYWKNVGSIAAGAAPPLVAMLSTMKSFMPTAGKNRRAKREAGGEGGHGGREQR